MWAIAIGIYISCKGLTLAVAHVPATATRKAAYFVFSFGMNASAFLARVKTIARPSLAQYIKPLINMIMGCLLLWGVAREIPLHHAILAGWVGMIGLIMLLHFGLLDLLSLLFQAAGFDAPPIMNSPLRSTSVVEFWSERWNLSFRQLAHQFLFRPMLRRSGVVGATLYTFLISGLLHDLVISIPAGGGYGLPTAYFLLQGLAMLFERSSTGRHLLQGPLARSYAIAVIALPVPLLFHQTFVRNVILPFMVVLHALPKEFLQ